MASYQYVYVMKDLTKAFPGGREVFKGITLAFLPGVKIGVLGVNGAGKSTLMKIMAGIDTEFGGEAWAAEGARVGYLAQEPQLDPDKTVGENVEEAFADLKAALEPLQRDLGKVRRADERRGDERSARRAGRPAGRRSTPRMAGTSTGASTSRWTRCAARRRRPPVTTLSGGERRRVALCRLLLEKPDLLLLDEPTNHLDAESVAWLEHTLHDYAGTVMIVTHDRYFLDNVTSWILEIERGRGYPFEGNYSSWLEQKRKRLAQEEKEESARQRALATEQEWIAASPRARQAKNRARIQRYEEMLARVAGAGGRRGGDRHPARAAPGQRGDRGGGAAQGLRQQPADRRSELQAAARRHRRRDRPERRRQDDAVPHDHRPGAAGRRQRCASARR